MATACDLCDRELITLSCALDIKKLERGTSVDDFEAVFFDDVIGEDFFGDALKLLLSFVAAPAAEIQDGSLGLVSICFPIGEPRRIQPYPTECGDRSLRGHPG